MKDYDLTPAFILIGNDRVLYREKTESLLNTIKDRLPNMDEAEKADAVKQLRVAGFSYRQIGKVMGKSYTWALNQRKDGAVPNKEKIFTTDHVIPYLEELGYINIHKSRGRNKTAISGLLQYADLTAELDEELCLIEVKTESGSLAKAIGQLILHRMKRVSIKMKIALPEEQAKLIPREIIICLDESYDIEVISVPQHEVDLDPALLAEIKKASLEL